MHSLTVSGCSSVYRNTFDMCQRFLAVFFSGGVIAYAAAAAAAPVTREAQPSSQPELASVFCR